MEKNNWHKEWEDKYIGKNINVFILSKIDENPLWFNDEYYEKIARYAKSLKPNGIIIKIIFLRF